MTTTNNIKPILFSTEMVQAILAGRKTQTRRIVQFDTGQLVADHFHHEHSNYFTFKFEGEIVAGIKSKYESGDILWVRETFVESKTPDVPHNRGWNFSYKADGGYGVGISWKPSLFMPKEACRIFLKVTNVRCERLQDISESDAIAEGIDCHTDEDGKLQVYCYPVKGKDKTVFCDSYISEGIFNLKNPAAFSFQTLWDSINEKKAPWKSNPFVWVYDFEITEKPENFLK